MKSKKEKMIAGKLYDPLDRELSSDRIRTRLLLKELNESREDHPEVRERILKELISPAGENLWIQPPFYCDNGYNM